MLQGLDAPGKAPKPVEAEAPRRSTAPSPPRERGPRIPAHLPIVGEVIDPEPVKACPEAWRCIGEEVTGQLDCEPARSSLRRTDPRAALHLAGSPHRSAGADRRGQSHHLHTRSMARARSVPARRSHRHRQQPGRERHPAHGRGQKELALHRRSRGRPPRSDPPHPRRKLPPPGNRPAGIPEQRPHAPAEDDDQPNPQPHPGSVEQSPEAKPRRASRCASSAAPRLRNLHLPASVNPHPQRKPHGAMDTAYATSSAVPCAPASCARSCECRRPGRTPCCPGRRCRGSRSGRGY